MKISVNAPSYKRPSNVQVLKYLPFCKIWVDDLEYEEYRKNNEGAEIIRCPKGVQGNLCRVRNYILRKEFENGMDVVLIVDDDLKSIRRYEVGEDNFGYEPIEIRWDEFLRFLEKYSLMAQDLGAKFWGIQINSDPKTYDHFKPFNTVAYIGGPFQCFIKGNRCWYDERLPLKEDYDMSLQQLNKERVVLRVNMYHYVCEQSTIPGGCAAYRNREREKQQFEALQRKWGNKIVTRDNSVQKRATRKKIHEDYNPILKIPIRGV